MSPGQISSSQRKTDMLTQTKPDDLFDYAFDRSLSPEGPPFVKTTLVEFRNIQVIMHLSSASPRGVPRPDVGTLLIVHFKVLVFPHPWGLFFLQSPHYLAKPSNQLDLKMHFRTLFWVFEQLANTRTLHSDEN